MSSFNGSVHIPAGLTRLVCLFFFNLTNQVDTPCDNKGKLLRPVFQGFRADPLSDTIVIVNPNVGDIQKNKYNSDKNQLFQCQLHKRPPGKCCHSEDSKEAEESVKILRVAQDDRGNMIMYGAARILQRPPVWNPGSRN